MNTSPFDSTQQKAPERQHWDTVAPGWRKWWGMFERSAQTVSDRLISLAQIEPGQRVLDIATGIGEPAITAARRVGQTGHVIATDLSPGMLAFAQERAVALGLQNMEFRELDAEHLDLLAGTFDAVLCRWGLMFLPNLAATLEKIRQKLVPGGHFAAAVWSPPARVPFISLPINIINQYIQVPSPSPGTLGPFSLADIDALKLAFAQAGFSEVRSEAMMLTFGFATASDFMRHRQEISASTNAMLASQSTEQQERIWLAIRDAAQQQYASTDGTVRIPGETVCIVGRG